MRTQPQWLLHGDWLLLYLIFALYLLWFTCMVAARAVADQPTWRFVKQYLRTTPTSPSSLPDNQERAQNDAARRWHPAGLPPTCCAYTSAGRLCSNLSLDSPHPPGFTLGTRHLLCSAYVSILQATSTIYSLSAESTNTTRDTTSHARALPTLSR